MNLAGTVFSADLGGSSNNLIENIKDRAKVRVPSQQHLMKGDSILRQAASCCDGRLRPLPKGSPVKIPEIGRG